MCDKIMLERFLANPVGWEVVLHDGSTAEIAAFRGHGSGRVYRLRGSRTWMTAAGFHSVVIYTLRLRSEA